VSLITTTSCPQRKKELVFRDGKNVSAIPEGMEASDDQGSMEETRNLAEFGDGQKSGWEYRTVPGAVLEN
jgi:hypothetical protein